MSGTVALKHALVVIADLRRDLLTAHDHGNCELCDKLERDLLDARAQEESWKILAHLANNRADDTSAKLIDLEDSLNAAHMIISKKNAENLRAEAAEARVKELEKSLAMALRHIHKLEDRLEEIPDEEER